MRNLKVRVPEIDPLLVLLVRAGPGGVRRGAAAGVLSRDELLADLLLPRLV